MNKKLCKIISASLSILFIATACSEQHSAEKRDLMKGISAQKVSVLSDTGNSNFSVTDFSLKLFKKAYNENENTLISPFSVLCALSMTANGADNNTLAQMENTFGLSTAQLNDYFYNYMQRISTDESDSLSIANSIWFMDSDDFAVNNDFLQLNADYYGADLFKVPFNNTTLNSINDWISNKTKGMIDKGMDDISPDAVMYLINAVAFEEKWEEEYFDTNILNGKFSTFDGKTEEVKYMYSEEDEYLEDENATGFMKHYKGGKYAFAALLPNDDISIADYVENLTTEKLYSMLSAPQKEEVSVKLPKFETKYDIDMVNILAEMGITDAFSGEKADFSKLSASEIGFYINKVTHKTYISVDEKGTKAAAVTIIEDGEIAPISKDEPKFVYLTKPFLYMIVDCETNTPIFIGTVLNVNG